MQNRKMPTVVIVLSEGGVQRSLIIAPEDDVELQERGHLLLARIAPQVALINNVLQQADAESLAV